MTSLIIDTLYRLKRGLSGYISYLAACEMNASFSEYILYEPTLRILTARGFTVECEFPCPGFPKSGSGDAKRLDFVARNTSVEFAIEMKWIRAARLNAMNDLEKLRRYRGATAHARAFLFLFGRKSDIEKQPLTHPGLREQGAPVFADLGKTKYGCRNYELHETEA